MCWGLRQYGWTEDLFWVAKLQTCTRIYTICSSYYLLLGWGKNYNGADAVDEEICMFWLVIEGMPSYQKLTRKRTQHQQQRKTAQRVKMCVCARFCFQMQRVRWRITWSVRVYWMNKQWRWINVLCYGTVFLRVEELCIDNRTMRLTRVKNQLGTDFWKTSLKCIAIRPCDRVSWWEKDCFLLTHLQYITNIKKKYIYNCHAYINKGTK